METMTNTYNQELYQPMRSCVCRRTSFLYAIKLAGHAMRRAGFIFIVLLALSPLCELMGLMSVEHVFQNASRTHGVGEFFGFFSSAFINTELELQLLTGAATVLFGGVLVLFVRDFFKRKTTLFVS